MWGSVLISFGYPHYQPFSRRPIEMDNILPLEVALFLDPMLKGTGGV